MRERAQSETERIIGWDVSSKSGSKVTQQLQDRQRTKETSGVLYICFLVFVQCSVDALFKRYSGGSVDQCKAVYTQYNEELGYFCSSLSLRYHLNTKHT